MTTTASAETHTRHCWFHATSTVSENLLASGFDSCNNPTDQAGDWGMTEIQVATWWLSDGTKDCVCDDYPGQPMTAAEYVTAEGF